MCEGGPLYNFEAAEQVRRGKERRLVATAAAPSATACAEVCIATFGCEGVGCRHDAGTLPLGAAAADASAAGAPGGGALASLAAPRVAPCDLGLGVRVPIK